MEIYDQAHKQILHILLISFALLLIHNILVNVSQASMRHPQVHDIKDITRGENSTL